MKNRPMILIFYTLIIGVFSCQTQQPIPNIELPAILKKDPDRIKVLNLATFHMGETSDGYSTDFDEHDANNVKEAHAIAKQLSAFQPTVIIVEQIPERDKTLQADYFQYLKNPKMIFDHPSEIELLAFEVGRISGTKRIYGIDHKLEYEWDIYNRIDNQIDTITPMQLMQQIPTLFEAEEKLSLKEKLKLGNTTPYLDLLITGNADILTHVGTENNFEGADEAARYYQRNLRMYSNLNRIKLTKSDRVFILMGGSHTAFFRDFISRSPKYEMVNTFDYLN